MVESNEVNYEMKLKCQITLIVDFKNNFRNVHKAKYVGRQ